MTIATLNPPLPTRNKPIIFYTNQLRDDLKRVILTSIGKSKHSLSIQIYGLTDPDVKNALEKAKRRGVDITLFYDPKGSDPLSFGYPVKTTGLMHRKILVVDETFTLIGSANFTTQSLKMHDNIIVGLFGKEVASHFGKPTDDSAVFSFGDCHLASFFLPDFDGKALDTLCTELKRATKSIKIAMFTLTYPKIVQVLSDAAKRGIKVHLAIDSYTMKGASKRAVESLKAAGSEIYVSRGKQLLHHKWALIDEEVFVMGSANWTKAAFDKNQDTLLIFNHLGQIEKKKLAKLWHAIAITSENS